MASVSGIAAEPGRWSDRLSGTPRAGFVDRWIYVFTAVSFVIVTLLGFIPDSIGKVAAVNAGARPPFPAILHIHAVLMGSFLLLLLAQTVLVATGRVDRHRLLGRAGLVIAPALVVVGLILVPTNYRSVATAAQFAPPGAREGLRQIAAILENIMLLQLRIGLLFAVLMYVGLRARSVDAGLHKRLMILAPAMAMPAATDRIGWLPTTFPASPLATDLYTVLLISPMLVWELSRNGRVHPAYLIWLGIVLPPTVLVHLLWDTQGWHVAARYLMGV